MGSTGATLLRFLLLASIVAGFAAHLAAGEKDCYDEKDSVMDLCIGSIKKEGFYLPPTTACRNEVKKVDMPCICRVLTASDERTVSPVKLVRLARECKIKLPVGSKCGTYTIGVRCHHPRTREELRSWGSRERKTSEGDGEIMAD